MALASCVDNDDFDLAAEILLTWPYLRSEWSSAAAFSLSLLAEMERNIGFLPSLSLRQKTLQRMSKAQRARYVVSEGYDTAYVMGLLSAAILACETAPPKFPQQAEKAFGNYDFYPMLLPKRHKPRWEYQYTSLSKEQKFALSGFVSTIGLRRALVKCNFRRLREILIASIEYGLTLSPAVHQGSLLLGRFISND